MKQNLFILIAISLLALFFLWSPWEGEPSSDLYAEQEGVLLVPQKNVAIAVLDLDLAGLSFTNPQDIASLRALHKDFSLQAGTTKVESILSASRVLSENDDIIVRGAIPKEDKDVTKYYLETLASELFDYPELTPYINSDLNTIIFYIYYGNRVPHRQIHDNLKDLQNKWKDTFPFEYTGIAPVIAETEFQLTRSLKVLFPLLLIMVVAVFSLFKNVKTVIASVFLILLSISIGYGFVRFLGIPDSPLVLLIPVFGLGLLSDYLIHFFYLHFHTEHGGNQKNLRKKLFFPLSLTALSTLTGFLSLSLINGSGHVQLGIIIAVSVVVTWGGVFFWLRAESFPKHGLPLFPRFQSIQVHLFTLLAKYRYAFFLLIAISLFWGGTQLFDLSIEPYPIQQLPASTTIKKADSLVNREFYGTTPFFIEIDTGETNGIMKKESMLIMDQIHSSMEENNVGYAFSLLSVMKRLNYYFMGSEDSFLTTNDYDDIFPALIEQYLLYYSSSVDPLDYESLLDNSYRYISIKGMIYYHSYEDLYSFNQFVEGIRGDLPPMWTLSVYGMAQQLEEEHDNLRKNWVLSFLLGSILIFVTVLFFYKKISLALLSLVPGIISMIISFGIIGLAGISIDAFSIVFVAIITGLVIDYSIHTLVALDQLEGIETLEEGFASVIGYSGIPIFLSFLTSLLSFSILFLSTFSGARSLGILLITSLVLSFFLSLYLIPLIILPIHLKLRSKKC